MKKAYHFAVLFSLVCPLVFAEGGQFLMVDENNLISPPGYTLGLDQIARAAAETELASNRVMAVADATKASQQVVSNLTEVLVGNTSFGYINGFIVSFGGVAAVSTNATCNIVKFVVDGADRRTIDGVEHSGHYIYYAFSEPMNSTPYIKWKSSLHDAEWNIVPTQDLTQYPEGTTLDGVTYANLYRSTAYTPTSLNRAFYLAYCDISAPDGDGSMLPIRNGIRINGQDGFTGSVTNENFVFKYQGGLLMERPTEIE